MTSNQSLFKQSLFFQLIDISYIKWDSNWNFNNFNSNFHTLFIFIDGSATVSIESEPFFATQGKCFVLKPETLLEMVNVDKNFLSFYKLTYKVIQSNENQEPSLYSEDVFHNQIEFSIYPLTRLYRLTEELYKNRDNKNSLEHLNKQIQFYELLKILIEYQVDNDDTKDNTTAVQQTIKFINEQYCQDLTVKQLADRAKIPSWQYSRIFKTLTGQKPLDYLTTLRIKNAKHLLHESDEPLRKIAQRVGFNDEYYFNRRFRQVVGVPPKQYAHFMRQKVLIRDWTGHNVEIPSSPKRIIYHGESLGDLLALGICPIGSNIENTFYKNYVRSVHDIGFPFNTGKCLKLDPDLIIFTNDDEVQYKEISKIAPTVTHNSWASLENRMKTLGKWLNKQEEAEDWISRYNMRENIMWQQLQSTLRYGETASVFTFDHGKRLFVMGLKGLPSSLYHSYGFQPVDPVKKIIDDGLGYMEISLDLLSDYAGDRVFILFPEAIESRLATEELIETSLWKSLPAVRNGHAYLVNNAKWSSGDAFTRERLLEELPKILLE
ncbi:ABC-type Fe3+-hydroxamate transport system, periplasmic component YbbB [Gottschalkia acidurici 9a]|uniref:ABC-type Fe3+-hydroxamate transport system, periplasmic component YbbB n=1 Tax=Gottschalkia acidurici (strain ATCC 7906 / DSM 604 / BCRC 14475 / CIP 104303 / KCTC 5404 / NCIMB 10678 / 9a) TaxID=1128398 RepID=K0AXK2_GOTA9|nr:AraC family transcriptional regulator [Gottschalkia acidurici]AFS77465.1 ABC-type Fe3+-hydroxamate transport system, periplasmic component YbbB [Gottschalkia acidurici 9a]